jgi:eukaryotic-like serine/threonine-protein kinase
MVGKVLAQYQICEKLGEGGMGVVWKARDTHLDRFVALKTLPAERLADPERKRRSVQEAKAASALNHANIVHIYDIAEVDGIQFISMEYVPGKTLDQLIGRKGLRLNEALKYAVQIADALAQAHSAGIIHRDLKPSNVIVGENGQVKVLDFGIAKLTEVATGEFGKTATMRAPDGPSTEEGAIVGTVAYMSPEQAEGKRIDARSDIFSFGSMLYEMVTGRQAFHGDSKLSTLSAILKDDPKPVSSVADVPRDLEKIINRCLRKDPDRRYQTMADLKVALQELKEESESGKLTGVASAGVPAQRKSRRMWTLAGTAVLLIVLIAVGFWFLRPRSHPISKTVPLTSYPGRQINPAFSPDGKQVAFAWDGEQGGNFDIYIKLVDAGTPLRLTNTPANETAPAWSPDGRYIAFCRDLGERSEVWVIPALGGPERRLGESAVVDLPDWGSRLSWSPDGKFLALADRSTSASPFSLYLMSHQTGEKRRLTSAPNGYLGDIALTFSPNGKTLAFIRMRNLGTMAIYLLSLSSSGSAEGEAQRLTPDQAWIGGFDFTPDGRTIVFSSGQYANTNLWAVSAIGGKPERLVGGENAAGISISRASNRLVYSRFSFDVNIWRIPGLNALDKNRAPTRFIASTLPDAEPQFSADGRKIVFTSSRSGTHSIWICDRDGLNAVELTSFDDTTVGSPRWSPDSQWVAFDSPKAGNWNVYIIRAEGGPVRQLTTGPSNNARPSWSRDGRWIYFGSNRSGAWQIWKAPADGGAALQVTQKGGYEVFASFDGKFVYYAKLGPPGIWKVPLGGGEEIQVLDHGSQGLWALTEQGIYFGEINSSFGPVLKFYRFATRQVETFKEFPKDTKIYSGSTAFSVSPDGQWIIYTQFDQASSDLMLMENYR